MSWRSGPLEPPQLVIVEAEERPDPGCDLRDPVEAAFVDPCDQLRGLDLADEQVGLVGGEARPEVAVVRAPRGCVRDQDRTMCRLDRGPSERREVCPCVTTKTSTDCDRQRILPSIGISSPRRPSG